MVGLHKNPEVMNGDSDDDSDDDNNTLRPQRRVPATSNFHSANQDDSSLVVKGILIGDFTSIYVKNVTLCYFISQFSIGVEKDSMILFFVKKYKFNPVMHTCELVSAYSCI